MTTDTNFPKHCQMAEDEALKAFLETAIDVASRMSWGLVDRKLQKLNGLKN